MRALSTSRKAGKDAPLCDADVCAATPADELVDAVVTRLALNATLHKLGPSCRETLERFHLLGESAASIAKTRDTTPNYIARLLSYCRQRARLIYREMSKPV